MDLGQGGGKTSYAINNNRNYGILLAVLLISLCLLIALRDPLHRYIFGFFFILGLSGATFTITRRLAHQAILLPSGLAALIIHIIFPTEYAPTWLNILDNGFWIFFTGALAWIVFTHVFNSPEVGKQQIFGAISVYLLVGILFTQLYEILIYIQGNAIYFDPSRFPDKTIGTSQVLYYSFVTLATVGYGDVSPFSPVARALSVFESLVGVMYIAILIARFVAKYEKKSQKERELNRQP
jgi:hypothetical protein